MTAGILVWAYTLLLPSFADIGIVGQRILTDGPFGIGMLRPQHLFGLDLPPLVHGVVWSLSLNIARLCRLLAARAAVADRAPAGQPVRAVGPDADRAELPALALVGDGRGTDHARSRAISARSARARRSKASPRRRGISLEPKDEADFRLVRHAEHMLASAIGAASSRLVLSLLLRKRTVSTKAALKLLDDANAAIQYNREILQTALDHVRQGIAVFDKDLQLICWNRQFGEILDLPPSLTRVGIGLDEILRFNAERGDVRRRIASRTSCASSIDALRRRQRAVPRALRRARPGDRGARQPHAGRRHRHDLHRHHAERRRRPRRWSAPTKRWSGACASAPRN